jgi:hypothetical protein
MGNATPPKRNAKPPLPPPKRQPPAKKSTAPAKVFKAATWDTAKEGQRIVLYADSGMGKTTLAAMLPNPKFADFKGGSDKIKHPLTSERLIHIPGCEAFDDVRAVCHQPGLFEPGDSFVLDTGTAFEDCALEWTLANVPHETNKPIKRIESYGYGKGYRHLYDTMKLPLADFDALIRRGVNVVISCQMQQVEIAHAGGEDFLCDVPKLQKAHGKSTPSVWSMYDEWADHVFKIGYNDIQASDGKAASTGERVVYVHGQVHYKAKSRTIPPGYPVVSFEHPGDDSIWQFLFDEAWRDIQTEGKNE